MTAIVTIRATTPATFWPVLGTTRLTKATRQPFFDGARALLACGHDPDELLEARHQGSDIVAMRSTIGEAAKWSIEERDQSGLRKAMWKPREIAVSSAAVAPENGLGRPEGHPTALGPLSAAGAPALPGEQGA